MTESDWPDVHEIYAAGIETGHATFEPAPPATWEVFEAGKHPKLRLVATDFAGKVLGWASGSPVSARAVYRGVVEDSIYIRPDAIGQGLGGRLLAALIERAEAVGVWTIQCSIFPENIASIRIHERHGFQVLGTRERIAYMSYGPEAGRWRDTVMLERRSHAV
ncbi:GNAT family N-acetyltransferase [Leucobacter coleopterorum]|nr:GNAT family N-acetyltransferase [Leucobacter coleopterorum]